MELPPSSPLPPPSAPLGAEAEVYVTIFLVCAAISGFLVAAVYSGSLRCEDPPEEKAPVLAPEPPPVDDQEAGPETDASEQTETVSPNAQSPDNAPL